MTDLRPIVTHRDWTHRASRRSASSPVRTVVGGVARRRGARCV